MQTLSKKTIDNHSHCLQSQSLSQLKKLMESVILSGFLALNTVLVLAGSMFCK